MQGLVQALQQVIEIEYRLVLFGFLVGLAYSVRGVYCQTGFALWFEIGKRHQITNVLKSRYIDCVDPTAFL